LERTYLAFFCKNILGIEPMPFAVLTLVVVIILGPHRRLLASE
jgi:hypothetical protein